jgi:serine/threonine protein kinase
MLKISDTIKAYRITSLISEGAFCSAYFCKKGDREYFIKEYMEPRVSSELFPAFFENQSIIIERLNAMGSVSEKFIEHFTEGESYYQVKEKLSGINLEEWLKTHESDEERMLLGIILCGIIGNLHSQGIVHQDLKPAQVMLVDDEKGRKTRLGYRPILSDFDWAIPDGKVAQTVGTLMYMSPEHYRSETPTEASDRFTVGIMLYELLTGQNPYDLAEYNTDEDTKKNVLEKHIAGEPVELNPIIPKEVSDMIVQCLDPDPDKRPGLTELQKAMAREKKAAGKFKISSGGNSMIIYGNKSFGRRELKLFFREITDDEGDPVYKYCDNDGAMLDFTKEEETFLVSAAGETRNYFLLNETRIRTSALAIAPGDTLVLYSAGRSKTVCSFEII